MSNLQDTSYLTVIAPASQGSDTFASTDSSPQPLGRLVARVVNEFNSLQTVADLQAFLYHQGPVQPKDLVTHGFRLCDSTWAREYATNDVAGRISKFIRQIQQTRKEVDALRPTFDAIAYSGSRARLDTITDWVMALEAQQRLSPLPPIFSSSAKEALPFPELLRRYDQGSGLVAQVETLANLPESEREVLQQIEETGLRASLMLCALQAFCSRSIRAMLSEHEDSSLFSALGEFKRADLKERMEALRIYDTCPGGEAFAV